MALMECLKYIVSNKGHFRIVMPSQKDRFSFSSYQSSTTQQERIQCVAWLEAEPEERGRSVSLTQILQGFVF